MASLLGRHGKKESVLPALVIVHAAHAFQFKINARREVVAAIGFPQVHRAIMPWPGGAGKNASPRSWHDARPQLSHTSGMRITSPLSPASGPSAGSNPRPGCGSTGCARCCANNRC